LTDLLNLIKLSPESIDKILEHDRWKTETVLEHNLQIEELRNKVLSSTSEKTTRSAISKDDIEFNTISSFTECNQSQVYRIARTKIKLASSKASLEMEDDVVSHTYSDSRYKDIPDENKKPVKIKSILTSIIYFALCLARFKRWPDAKDKSSMPLIREEFEKDCMGSDKATLEVVCDAINDKWMFYFSGVEFERDEVLNTIRKSVLSIEEIKKASDIKLSPLFTEAALKLPQLNLNTLENYYKMLSGKFIDAGIRTLTIDFISNRPQELDYTDQFAEWSNIYIDHLHSYKETWKNQLKEIETDTWDRQLQWRKESTSLPTANP
jgi:hypothetical protein